MMPLSLKFDWNHAFMPYDERWREQSRVFHQFFNPNAVQNYAADQRREAHRLAMRLINQPEDFVRHIRQ